MNREQLEDLDELALRCKEVEARSYISEAIACYRAGAFRAAIVSTWVAVVYDFIYKLRQLELTGDKNAKKVLLGFENARLSRDIPKLSEFESNTLDLAENEFELISSTERSSLQRLYEDRHLCAHPSMKSLEEPYQPGPDLARYHIQNAIKCFLQFPPVQGKAALDMIWADISSPGFPRSTDKAIALFQSGPLVHGRDSLVSSIVIGLTKSLLNDDNDASLRERQFAALTAIIQLHFQVAEQTLTKKLSDIVRAVTDDHFHYVYEYLVRVAPAYSCLREHAIIKVNEFLTSLDASIARATEIVANALQIRQLNELARSKVSLLPISSILSYPKMEDICEYLQRIVDQFNTSATFDEANSRWKIVRSVYPRLAKDEILSLLEAYTTNSQVRGSYAGDEMIQMVFQGTKEDAASTKDLWQAVYKVNKYNSETIAKRVQKMIVERYPDTPAISTAEEQALVKSLDQEA